MPFPNSNEYEKYFDSKPPLNEEQLKEWINRGIYCDDSNGDINPSTFLMSSTRYFCTFSDKSIHFTDLFNGQTRSFAIFNASFHVTDRFIAYARLISGGYLLAKFQSSTDLARLDFEKNTCTFFSQFGSPLICFEYFAFDELNERRFIATTDFNGALCSFENGQINQQPINIWMYSYCLKLNGNLLYGMDMTKHGYWEMNLITGEKTKKFQFLFQNSPPKMNLQKRRKYSWINENVCYVLYNDVFLKFDVEFKNCVEIELLKDTRIKNFSLLDENQLVFQSTSNLFYKFQLRKPDQLMNITWHQMRRYKSYRKNDKLMKNLPFSEGLTSFDNLLK